MSEILCMSSLPASIKRIELKATEKKWRHHFPHCKSVGAFCCHGHQCFDPICLKTLCSFYPPPLIQHIKFDQDWPTGLTDIQVRKCKIFVIQGQVTPKWVVWSGPISNLSELLRLFWLPATLMMIRSKVNELAWRQHFPIISLWEIFRRSRAAHSVVSGPIWPKFKLIRACMNVLVICKYKKDRIKHNREKVASSFFPITSQWGLSVAMETRVLIQSAQKPYATPVMLHVKFDQD